MESEMEESGSSLFEGMVLFNPTHISLDDGNGNGNGEEDNHHHNQEDHPSPPPSCTTTASEGNPPSTVAISSSSSSSSSSALPLDENLFSDLTLVLNPVQSPTLQSQSQSQSMSRQVSRRKKRAGLRIGYGRDSISSLASSDHLNSHFHPNQPNYIHTQLDPHFIYTPTTPSSTISAATEKQQEEDDDDEEEEEEEEEIEVDKAPSLPNSQHANSLTIEKEEPTLTSQFPDSYPSPKALAVAINFKHTHSSTSTLSTDAPELEPSVSSTHVDAQACGDTPNEQKLEHIRTRVLHKLQGIREFTASVSSTKKESLRRRRNAAHYLNLASNNYKELEMELEDACETEDFERAERVSESLAAAENDKQGFIINLREAEADCDSVDLKMQEVLELQIAAEEEGVSLLEQFTKDAANNADLVLKSAKVHASKEIDEWLLSTEALEVRKMELEIESHLISDTCLGLNDSIEQSIKDDEREKELLCEKRDILTAELEKLLSLVRQKEAEIAENDFNIQAVEKRITDVVSGFHGVQSSINMKYDNLQSALSRNKSDSEALSMKKKEVDDFLSQEQERGAKLRELASVSADESKARQELVTLRKRLAQSVLKSREDKVNLAKTEEKILEDVQMRKEEVSSARASLQELSSARSGIQQEIASSKQRILFIDKRGPELESEKKVAAAARNFKEAGRIAAEVKKLSIEKENVQVKMEKAILELGKIEEEVTDTVNRLQHCEELILSKEKEAAMARCKRLHLAAAATMSERSAALELGGIEEANVLLAEAEAAESEATKLQQAYDFKQGEFENLRKQFISMEQITSLGGKQLAAMAESAHLFASQGSQV